MAASTVNVPAGESVTFPAGVGIVARRIDEKCRRIRDSINSEKVGWGCDQAVCIGSHAVDRRIGSAKGQAKATERN